MQLVVRGHISTVGVSQDLIEQLKASRNSHEIWLIMISFFQVYESHSTVHDSGCEYRRATFIIYKYTRVIFYTSVQLAWHHR